MVNEVIVDILARRIINGELNPKTGLPMRIEDIKSAEYQVAVEARIAEIMSV